MLQSEFSVSKGCVKNMKLSHCIAPLISFHQQVDHDPEILHIEIDSRKVTEGSLFVCIKGHSVDSHQFAEDAVNKGAVALVAETYIDVSVPVIYVNDSKRALAMIADQFYNSPTHHLHLVGVTGTNGKTTVTHLVKEIFDHSQRKTGLIGTIGMKYDNKTIPVDNTTPESFILQKNFREMVDADVTHAVIEVSSHALVQGRVRGCDFNIAVFTNLSQDHLDYHRSMEEYLHAKSLLFSQLGNTYGNGGLKVAILNRDDQATSKLLNATAAQVLTYGIESEADFKAENIQITSQGTEFQLITPIGNRHISTKLMGKFNVYNALAALLTGYVSGLNLDQMIDILSHIKGIPGRFEGVQEDQDYAVIVDYSHTPDSLENALLTIKGFVEGRIITVVGCGGDRDRSKRPLMAKVAVENSDLVVLTSDNPRTEDPEKIIQEMETGVAHDSYVKLANREEAIYYAIQHAKPKDVVLIAGKGHETYQIIGKVKHHFDDREVAREAIKAIKN